MLFAKKTRILFPNRQVNWTFWLLISLFVSVWCVRCAVGLYCISCISAENNDLGNQGLTVGDELLNSMVHALQTFSMDEDYTVYISTGKEMIGAIIGGKLAQIVYGIVTSIQNVLAPIAGGAFILDVLTSLIPQLKLHFLCNRIIRIQKKRIYFSVLNEKSLALAKDILETSDKNPIIVFSDVYVDGNSDEKRSEMLAEAKKLGMICLRDDLTHIRKPSYGDREYYLMDEFESENLQKLIGLTASENVKFVKDSKIYFFVQSDLYVQIEKQIRGSFDEEEKKKLLGDGKMPTLIPIDEYRNLVQNLFDEVPLFEPLIDKDDKNELKLTIFGNGMIGTQALLNAYWLGQMMTSTGTDKNATMTTCRLAINVVSKDKEDTFYSKLDYINPEIRKTAVEKDPILGWNPNDDNEFNPSYCTINYTEADVKKGDVLSSEKIGQLLDSDYFVVALGNDFDNIAVAEKLHGLIGEKHITSDFRGKAVIAYAVFDPELARTLNRQKKYYIKEDDNEAYLYMHAFGSIDSVYCCDNVFMTKHSLISKQIGNAYTKAQMVNSRINQSRNDEKSNYNYWGDLARAAHIRYKLFSLGWITTSVFQKEDTAYKDDIEEQYKIYQKLAVLEKTKLPEAEKKELMSDLEGKCNDLERKKEYLAWLEHRRWCAFVRTMGYRSVEIEKVLKTTGENKDHRLKLQACIVEAFQPKNCGDTYRSDKERDCLDHVAHKTETNYKEYDYYSFEFGYKFVSVLKEKVKKVVKDRCLDKYFNENVYSDTVDFGNGVIAVPPEDVEEALRKDNININLTGDSTMKNYVPHPIDTEKVELPESLLELTEKIAENVHENWSAGRMSEGWTYGETRDDEKKTNPCLVPYSELTDSEKEYDRTTAIQTLKLIVALGYEIKKREP